MPQSEPPSASVRVMASLDGSSLIVEGAMLGGRRDWRLAIQADAEAIADVYFASHRLLDFLPKLHDLDSYQWYGAKCDAQ